jgi:hypothetical protein
MYCSLNDLAPITYPLPARMAFGRSAATSVSASPAAPAAIRVLERKA